MTTNATIKIDSGSHKVRITVQDRNHSVESGPEKWSHADTHELNPGESREIVFHSTRRFVVEELTAPAEQQKSGE